MKAKFRVVRIGNKYYPQARFLWFWSNCAEYNEQFDKILDVSFDNQIEAELFLKIKKEPEVNVVSIFDKYGTKLTDTDKQESNNQCGSSMVNISENNVRKKKEIINQILFLAKTFTKAEKEKLINIFSL
jgi:hypothetical protein